MQKMLLALILVGVIGFSAEAGCRRRVIYHSVCQPQSYVSSHYQYQSVCGPRFYYYYVQPQILYNYSAVPPRYQQPYFVAPPSWGKLPNVSTPQIGPAKIPRPY